MLSISHCRGLKTRRSVFRSYIKLVDRQIWRLCNVEMFCRENRAARAENRIKRIMGDMLNLEWASPLYLLAQAKFLTIEINMKFQRTCFDYKSIFIPSVLIGYHPLPIRGSAYHAMRAILGNEIIFNDAVTQFDWHSFICEHFYFFIRCVLDMRIYNFRLGGQLILRCCLPGQDLSIQEPRIVWPITFRLRPHGPKMPPDI